MDNYDVKRLALVLAVQADIEGMKSYNKHREKRGEDVYYTERDFYAKALELRNLAHAHNEQL